MHRLRELGRLGRLGRINNKVDESSSEDEYQCLEVSRRQYKMMPRIDIDKWDDNDFVYRFRLEKGTTLMILEIIKDELSCDERRSRELRKITQILIFLRYCALGSFQVAISDFSGVCIATIHNVLHRVGGALAKLRPQFVKMPTTQQEMVNVSREFFSIVKFPRTIGAIDCSHIKIQSPGGDEAENYRNRKGWFSLNVQAVVDVKLKILDIVARWPGASHDQTIFNNSKLKTRFERGDFGHFILVGDSGYKNTKYLATPFLSCNSGSVESFFNESQIRTRNVVERSFGVWKRRFPVLATGMRCDVGLVQKIVIASAVLHNFAIDQRDILIDPTINGFADMLEATQFNTQSQTERVEPQCSRHAHETIRDQLVRQYFGPMMRNSI